MKALIALAGLALAVTGALAQEGASEPAREGARAPAGQAPSSVSGAAPVDPAAAARGQRLFNSIGCSGCHGTVGQGGIGPMAGPRIATRAELSVETLEYFLRNPPGAMPPYSEKVLGADKIRDIHAYLAGSFKPAKASDIPMLRTQR